MNTTASLFLSTLLATTLVAQDDAKKAAPHTPTNPKTAEHDAFKPLVGTWEITMKNEAMPGVPGMEQPGESKGIERVELLNNGLWLKSSIDGDQAGKPFQVLWLVGYDPHQKQYVGACVCSDEQNPGVSTMNGTYDQAKKSWTFSGKTPHGAMRSVMTAEGADAWSETCYMTGTDGQEKKVMHITRKRANASAARPADASASTGAKLPAEIAAMQKDVGEWDATVRCSGLPGQGPIEEKGTEKVTTILGGRWLWSDFKGQFQGQPFEGHCLSGYDPVEKKVVSIWIDSMSPTWCKTTGAPSAGGEIKLDGTCIGPNGQKMTVKQTIKHTGDASRTMHMESNSAEGATKMEITYNRKK